ncbi:uncharacterized protein LOC111628605 [Centruroides sculpturatus]|uniref:uncharacterized protein LOC111628604 n=1 Tax=Centruroides sculpturatus TaxID=218467 RepID=UPI000C6D05A5|nr:uncharacterized protein LOC111628604 [Centruroides sculpturatus]XP_023228199.1 uncharacterized protein LOC111628604 [Centruroides sculpturatus]XP_023228200.1 uncharacterized protein LOC111628605 [Centruroides sculpturatus]
MILFIEGCLCYTDTKQGSIATAIFTLVTRALFLVAFSILISQGYSIVFIKNTEHYSVSLNLTIATLADCCILIILSLILLYGLQKNKRHFVLPWMMYMPIEIIGSTVSSIVLMGMFLSDVIGTHNNVICVISIGLIIWAGFNLYLLLSVISHYQVMAGIISIKYPIYVKDFSYDSI